MMIPRHSYFFVFVSLVLHTLVSPTLQYCRHGQRDALMEFKHEFSVNKSNSNPYGSFLKSWNKSSDCCSWDGVTCDDKSGKVISLDLFVVSLNNSLKPNSGLFKLQHLRTLSLISCDLYGEIPSSLGNLSRLTDLSLHNNHLMGQLPSSIGNLSQLRQLDLSLNNFNGNIPVFLWKYIIHLRHFEFFDVSDNSFFGPFPTSLFTIPSLTHVDLRGNQFKGPIEFGNLSSSSTLVFLDFSHNKFDGPIPKSIHEFLNLGELHLSHNNFTGPILKFISNLVQLSNLDLSHNNFTGPIPKSISNLVHLWNLDLSHNNFIGPIPTFISELAWLNYFDLSHNNFIGPIPTSISKLVNLESLDLSNNNLEGQVPSFLLRVDTVMLSHNSLSSFGKSMNFSSIMTLDLSSNSFQEPLPRWICKLTSLEFLDLSNNSFSGSIPQCLEDSIVVLKELILHNNNLSGTIPDIFVNAINLMSIDVSGNQLEGKLPKSLINCTSLKFLNVERNKIKDKFPSWLGSSLSILHVLILRSNLFYGPLYHPHSIGFQRLKVLDISHNGFSGNLPAFYFSKWREMTTFTEENDYMYMEDYLDLTMGDEFYRFSMEMVRKGVYTEFERIRNDFTAIDFSGNKLYGNIPESIGLLKGLLLLNLSGNAFSGSIPRSLASLTKLEALDLSRNQLSGEIPQDLGSLSFLSTMDFSHNKLEGPIPRGTQFQRQNCSSFMDNPKLHGLEDVCGETHVTYPTPQETEDLMWEPEEEVIKWLAAAIAYGPGVFCGLVIGHIFASHKHEWLMEKFGRNKPRRATRRMRSIR